MAANPAASRGLVALVKRGWNEIPEVLASGVQALVGVAIMGFGLKHYYDTDGDNRPYRTHYVVLRHDDPKVPTLKTHCDVTSVKS